MGKNEDDMALPKPLVPQLSRDKDRKELIEKY